MKWLSETRKKLNDKVIGLCGSNDVLSYILAGDISKPCTFAAGLFLTAAIGGCSTPLAERNSEFGPKYDRAAELLGVAPYEIDDAINAHEGGYGGSSDVVIVPLMGSDPSAPPVSVDDLYLTTREIRDGLMREIVGLNEGDVVVTECDETRTPIRDGERVTTRFNTWGMCLPPICHEEWFPACELTDTNGDGVITETEAKSAYEQLLEEAIVGYQNSQLE